MIKFSIIIPIYNAEKYLERCINSILNQTYSNIEILLINDGSQDQSLEICSRYKNHSNIRIINKKNGGVSSARNTGLKEASGDYITFLDADDYIANNTFEIIEYILINNNIDVLKYGYYKTFNKIKTKYKFNVTVNEVIEDKNFKEKILPYLFNTNDFGNVWNLVIKSNIAKQIKFDENKKYAEDRKYSFDILMNSKNIYVLDLPLYYYVININSAMNNKNYETAYKQLLDILDTTNYLLNKCEKKYKFINKKEILFSIYFDLKSYLVKTTNFSYQMYLKKLKKVFNIADLKKILNKYDELNNSYKLFKNKKMFIKIRLMKLKEIIKTTVKEFMG